MIDTQTGRLVGKWANMRAEPAPTNINIGKSTLDESQLTHSGTLMICKTNEDAKTVI